MLSVALFSYNRGKYLQNCVASVRRNMPDVSVTVYDDNSDDPATHEVLAGLDVPVWQPAQSGADKHGGLYANMQAALERADSEMILFLQDDMQVVRPVGSVTMRIMQAAFEADLERAFVCPVFMKARRRARYQRHLMPDLAARLYRLPDAPVQEAYYAYFDVTVAHVARLRAAGWQFAGSENANISQARGIYSDQPFLADPFVFYCPEVPVLRNRRRTLAARLAERVTGHEVKRLVEMTRAETDAFCARPLEAWPIAEDFLRAQNPGARKPFVYKNVDARWWLKALHKLELRLGRR